MEFLILILGVAVTTLIAILVGLWASIVSLRRRVERAEVRVADLGDTVTALTSSSVARPERPPAPPPPAEVHAAAPPPADVDIAAAPPAEDTWEATVGGSWFNKIGAAVLVIGIAYGVGHSMTTLGPAGRVAIGFATSLALLAAGVLLERRTPFRTYAYGLIAGGWAGTYFTTFAMHGVPAARIVESDVTATASLAVVAVGMIAHSLRYRSRTVTGLAYVVAFGTLLLSPFTNFSLVASLPLAVSLILVSHRLGWTGISALGIAATYLLFVIRTQTAAEGVLDPLTLPPYLMLATYWAVFEILDLMARRAGRTPPGDQAALFGLNAMGLLGAGMVLLPRSGDAFSIFAGVTAAAYLTSAILRAWLTPEDADDQPGGHTDPARAPWTGFTTHQAAVAVSAALAMLSIGTRFEGTRATGGLFLVAGLLFTAGLALGDRIVRHLGACVAAVVLAHALSDVDRSSTPSALGPLALHPWSVVAGAIAATWYGLREWLRRRREPLELLEHAYTWAASWLALTILTRELTGTNLVLGCLVLAAVLIEAGVRRDRQYGWQGYAVGTLAATWVSALFWLDAESITLSRTMITLGAATAFGYGLAARLGSRFRIEASVLATFGTYALALLEYRALPETWLGPALAITALALLVVGGQGRPALLRWHAVVLFVLAGAGALQPIVDAPAATAATPAMLFAAVATTLLIWTGTLLWRRYIRTLAPDDHEQAEVEEFARVGLSGLAAAVLTVLIAHEAPGRALTLLWGLEGALLLVFGFPARERVMRLSGLAVLSLAIGRVLVFDLREQDALARVVSAIVLGLLLLAVSWVYTRYRDQIRRYL